MNNSTEQTTDTGVAPTTADPAADQTATQTAHTAAAAPTITGDEPELAWSKDGPAQENLFQDEPVVDYPETAETLVVALPVTVQRRSWATAVTVAATILFVIFGAGMWVIGAALPDRPERRHHQLQTASPTPPTITATITSTALATTTHEIPPPPPVTPSSERPRWKSADPATDQSFLRKVSAAGVDCSTLPTPRGLDEEGCDAAIAMAHISVCDFIKDAGASTVVMGIQTELALTEAQARGFVQAAEAVYCPQYSGQADPTGDPLYLDTLAHFHIDVPDPAHAISSGHWVCSLFGAGENSVTVTRDVMQYGASAETASEIVVAAVDAYCPQFKGK